MFNKKSQAAMEFLMTYGWAIMIVLIGIGALFFLGVFNPSTPSTCNVASPFICQDALVTVFQGAYGVVLRIAATNVDTATISAITINGISCLNTRIRVGTSTNYGANPLSQDVTSAKNTALYIYCDGTSGGPAPGSKASGEFTITYTKQFGVQHVIKGSYSGTAEG